MNLSCTERIDLLNIGLMIISCITAIIIPFECFLIAYAILGPLHYLTEISWLHDRNYFTKAKYDGLFIIAVGVILTLSYFNNEYNLGVAIPIEFNFQLIYIVFLSSLIFVVFKKLILRALAFILLFISAQIANHFWIFLTVFLPTLVHVYIFTALFMINGYLKNKSALGLASVSTMFICPIFLFTSFTDYSFIQPSEIAQEAYKSFDFMTSNLLNQVMKIPQQASNDDWRQVFLFTKPGILLARFIAFAYTYHYLNWFSKTEVIKWHKIPKTRLFIIILLWIASISIYAMNYEIGYQWLFFLSFLHVILEFPLNMVSIVSIGKHAGAIFKPQTSQQLSKVQ